MSGISVDKEIVRAAAIARAITEVLTDDERRDLLAEVFKPLLIEGKDRYGDPSESIFSKAVKDAFREWVREITREHCQRPDIATDLEGRIKTEWDLAVDKQVPELVKDILKRAMRL